MRHILRPDAFPAELIREGRAIVECFDGMSRPSLCRASASASDEYCWQEITKRANLKQRGGYVYIYIIIIILY